MNFYTSLQERIKVNDKPLGRGGEGNVYEVLSIGRYKGYVAKIYHPKERRKERELKLIYMLSNKPQFEDKLSVIWPEEILYENNRFVGFLMRKANSAIDLTSLCSLRIPEKLGSIWKRKYDRNTRLGLQNRVKVCKHIAAALAQMHKTGHYVLVDIKPENIKVNLKGQVSVIDIDSVEVINNQKLMFPADKTSPEYSPAEIKQLNIKSDFIEDSWDRFSMAVVFYKVLFGLHPFTGTCKAPYDKLVSNEDKISKGLFPIGIQKSHFQVIPRPHKAFYSIAVSVQRLFMQCFEAGYKNPSKRPTAQEWYGIFHKSPRFDPIDRHYKPKNKLALAKKLPVKKLNMSLPALIKSSVVTATIVGATSIGITQLASFTLPKNFLVNPNMDKKMVLARSFQKENVYVGSFHDGVAKVKKNGKYGLISEDGKGLTKYKYDWADSHQKGGTRVGVNEKYGLVNNQGKEIIPLKYDWIGKPSEGLTKVRLNDKTGFVDLNNKLVIDFKFDYADAFKNGLARVKIGENWGFINRKGELVVQAKYQKLRNFYDGRALVVKDKKVGYINKLGEEVIKPQFRYGYSFINGRAQVYDQKGNKLFIDKFGEILTSIDE